VRRKRLLLVLAVLAGLLVAGAGVLVWVVSSERGARLAFEQLGSTLPGKLTIEKLRGTIRGPLEVTNLRYETDRVRLGIERMDLDWSLRALARGRLDIRGLDAERAWVVVLPVPRDTIGPELPDINLPLDVMVRRARIDHIEVTVPGRDSAFVIDRATLDRVAFRDTLHVGSLRLESTHGSVEMHGLAHTRGRYAVDFGGDFRYVAANGAEWRGRGTMIGSLDSVRVDQIIDSPFEGRLAGVVVQPLRRPGFVGQATFSRLDPRRIAPQWPAGEARGTLTVNGGPAAFTSRGVVDLSSVEWGLLHLDYAMTGDAAGYRIEQATLTQPRARGRIVASGRVAPGGPNPAFDLTARWSGIALPVNRPTVTSSRGALHVWGPMSRYRLAGELVAGGGSVPEKPWRFGGAGTPRSVELTTLRGELLAGAITGRATASWTGPLEWRVALAGSDLDPAIVWPSSRGRVGFALAGHGAGGPDGMHGDLAVRELTGAVNGQPVSGRIDARFGPGSLHVDSLRVAWGPDRLEGGGLVAPSLDVRWTLVAPNLSFVIPHGGGALESRGWLAGSRLAPRGEIALAGDSLRWEGGLVDSVSALARLDAARASNVRIDATRIRTRRRTFDRLAFTVDGSRGQHVAKLAVASSEDSLTLEASGAFDGRAWRGQLTRLDFVAPAAGSWSLEHSATLAASTEQASLTGFCWRSTNGRACGDAGWRRDGSWTLRSTLEAVKLALLEPQLPAGVQLAGTMNGDVALRGVGRHWTGDARFDVGPGQISYPIDRKRRGQTPIDPSRVTMRSDARGLRVDANVSLGAAGTMRGDLLLPDFEHEGVTLFGGRLDGHLDARFTDLAFLQAFVADLSAIRGALTANLAVGGTLRRPRWSGQAELTGGAATIERLDIQLLDGTLSARSDADGRLAFQGGVRSGPGRLTIDGHASIDPKGVPVASATVSGDRVQAIHTTEASMLVSPRLELAMVGDSMHVTGEILVPQARLSPKKRNEPAIQPSLDVVYLRGDSTWIAAAAPRKLSAEIRLVLGDDVRVRSQGLDAKLTGSVLAIERPGRPTTGSGELRVDQGTYVAYGRNLTIDRGRLLFGGGVISNPGLDVRATRTARDGVVAGFEVQGTLEAPRFSVFSDPPMPDRDALAYVVLGRSLDRSNESQQAMVSDAAANLGVSGGSFLASKFANELGIEEASLQSAGGFHDASLMLGKYLSPRLYVNYGIGVLDQVSTLRIQYFVNKTWTLQAEAGTENRAEIFYTVER
jgi:translocation and assembly module TamB